MLFFSSFSPSITRIKSSFSSFSLSITRIECSLSFSGVLFHVFRTPVYSFLSFVHLPCLLSVCSFPVFLWLFIPLYLPCSPLSCVLSSPDSRVPAACWQPKATPECSCSFPPASVRCRGRVAGCALSRAIKMSRLSFSTIELVFVWPLILIYRKLCVYRTKLMEISQ